MKNLRVVFMGTPLFSVPILEALIENCNVVGLVCQPDKEVGRKRLLEKPPTKVIAEKHNITVLQPRRIREDYECVMNLNPDIIITCAYGQIIPKELLDFPKYKCVNVHASLLPKLRGGAPIHRAIMNGDKVTGITIMYMDVLMDNGDMIEKRKIEITDIMTTGKLHDELSILGRDLLLEVLPNIITGNITPVKQNEEDVTFAKLIKREDELIDFNKTSLEIYNQIRGLNPSPLAYTVLDKKVMKVYESRIGSFDSKKEAGSITCIYEDGIGVKTGDGEIILLVIKPEGKNKISVKDYLNGTDKKVLINKSFSRE